MRQLTVEELRMKHQANRKVQARMVAKKKRKLANDIKFTGGIILGILSMWFTLSILFSI